jgi:three-Cys-motif partner protein
VIAIRHARRSDVVVSGAPVRLLFLEADARRAQHLAQVVERSYPFGERAPGHSVEVVEGHCESDLLARLAAIGGWHGPVFANLDGFGVDTPLAVVRRIGQQPSSEVLVTFQHQWFTRFAQLDAIDAGDRVFGDTQWRAVQDLPSPTAKRSFLITEYRRRLHDAGFTFTLTFELVDEGGHELLLVFGTSKKLGLERMKEALWVVDPLSGERFRDPRDPKQFTLGFGEEVDLAPLKAALIALLRDRGQLDHAAMSEHALLETVFMGSHVRVALGQLRDEAIVNQVGTGRSHRERIYALSNDGEPAAPTTLF